METWNGDVKQSSEIIIIIYVASIGYTFTIWIKFWSTLAFGKILHHVTEYQSWSTFDLSVARFLDHFFSVARSGSKFCTSQNETILKGTDDEPIWEYDSEILNMKVGSIYHNCPIFRYFPSFSET